MSDTEKSKQIIFFSDIHGNLYSFIKFLQQIKTEDVEKIFFLGDIFGYYYYPNEILTLMREYNIICLLGNHDKFFLDLLDGLLDEKILTQKYGNSYNNITRKIDSDNIDFLKTLKSCYSFVKNDLHFGLFHGSLEDPLNGRIYPDTIIENPEKYQAFDYVILGHTHHKMCRQIGKTKIINPGSLGQQRDGKGCSYLVFCPDSNKFDLKTVEYDISRLDCDIDYHDNGRKSLKEVLYRKEKFKL